MSKINFPALFFSDPFNFPPTTKVKSDSMVQTCDSPQVVECDTEDGIRLYIRWKDGNLTCQQKWNGEYIASGNPVLERDEPTLTFDRIEFYLEMYSKFKMKFV